MENPDDKLKNARPRDGQKPFAEVVAALIRDKNKFLICKRPPHKKRGLLWEFVGGKAEKGETKEQALVRECEEELAITVEPKDIFMQVMHDYPDLKIRLTVFNCVILRGQLKLLEHVAVAWITPDEIPNYDFCPADEEILKKIMEL